MDTLTQTWVAQLKHSSPSGSQSALLVRIYPTGAGMGTRYPLKERPLVLGRSEACDVRIDDCSVSRRHALIQPDEDGFEATDLGSTNGTFVNNSPVAICKLKDGDYLRVGNCIFRFLTGGNVEAEYHEEIYRMAIIDGLTDVHNKRYLLEFLERELARAARRAHPVSLLLFDIDHFKSVNDERGHQAGDMTLSALAARIKKTIRRDELFARYGGEEFAIVLPDTPHEQALEVAERVRALVAAEPFSHDGESFPVTISLGVAATSGHGSMPPDELICLADKKLYEAKSSGRNCVRG